jgi:DNA-binding MarR family transcriptional regulator
MTRAATGSIYAGTLPALIIADEGPGGAAAVEAITLAGGRAAGRVDWAGAAVRLAQQGALGLMMVEAEDADDELIERLLPEIIALARATDARIVIALADRQIDLVAAYLLGGPAELLCAPSVADRAVAAALALVPRAGERLHDSGRTTESLRLKRLNEEVARIAKLLARLTRDDPDMEAADPGIAPDGASDDDLPEIDPRSITARDVRETIRVRRLRDQFFERGLFEDPAWDMLLDLYAAELERAQVSVSSLCIAAAVAPTTALRWIAKMTEAGLFIRQADPFDKRRAFMALSPAARTGMRGYFVAMKRAGTIVA